MTYTRCFSDVSGLFYVTRDDGKVISFDDATSAENCLKIASRVDESLWRDRRHSFDYHEVDSWAVSATRLMEKLKETQLKLGDALEELRNIQD